MRKGGVRYGMVHIRLSPFAPELRSPVPVGLKMSSDETEAVARVIAGFEARRQVPRPDAPEISERHRKMAVAGIAALQRVRAEKAHEAITGAEPGSIS
jgi:hypothetical protein